MRDFIGTQLDVGGKRSTFQRQVRHRLSETPDKRGWAIETAASHASRDAQVCDISRYRQRMSS